MRARVGLSADALKGLEGIVAVSQKRRGGDAACDPGNFTCRNTGFLMKETLNDPENHRCTASQAGEEARLVSIL